MISKKITCAPKNDSYRRLAEYIADTGNNGEKVLCSWTNGCWSGDDYSLGIQEIEDTQRLNIRTKKAKTYHLIISFRHEDESKLTPEVCKEIEALFAFSLGLSEHQRHCGVHKNTNNLHMHVAYNLVHPEKLTFHDPFRDYAIRDKLCREIERTYSLARDNGKNKKYDPQKLTEPAMWAEIETGEQSFESYAKSHREMLLEKLEKIADWQGVHALFATYAMEIQPKGNGLIIKDKHSKVAIKASTLDRSLSFKKLVSRFGAYEKAIEADNASSKAHYEKKPIHKGADRGNLYKEYQAGVSQRKELLSQHKQAEDKQRVLINEQWRQYRFEITLKKIPRSTRIKLLKIAKLHEQQELDSLRKQRVIDCSEVRKKIPYTSWTNFLQLKAEQGNETALAILRSRKEQIQPERVSHNDTTYLKKLETRQQFRNKEKKIYIRTDIKNKNKKKLLSIIRMQRLISETSRPEEEKTKLLANMKYAIDKKGTVIFTLPSGTVIRDNGKEILASQHDAFSELVREKLKYRIKESSLGK